MCNFTEYMVDNFQAEPVLCVLPGNEIHRLAVLGIWIWTGLAFLLVQLALIADLFSMLDNGIRVIWMKNKVNFTTHFPPIFGKR